MAATGLIPNIGGPSMATSMVSVVCTIPLPAGSYTAPSLTARVAAAPTVPIWAAFRETEMVLLAAVLLAIWSSVTLPRCPTMVNPE